MACLHRSMQTEVLNQTRCLGEESGIGGLHQVGEVDVDGQVVTLSIVLSVKPVAQIEHRITLVRGNLYIVHLLHGEASSVAHLVLYLTPVEVLGAGHHVVAIHMIHCQMVVIKVSAGGAHTVVPRVGGCCHSRRGIAVGHHRGFGSVGHLHTALTTGCHRCIHLSVTLAEDAWQGAGVLADGLPPHDFPLVIIEHIAHLAACEVVGRDESPVGHIGIILAPLLEGKVVVAGSVLAGILVGSRTELHILGGIKGYEVAPFASEGCACIGDLEISFVVHRDAVLYVGASISPTYDSTAALGACALDDDAAHAVADECTLGCHCHHSGMRSIASHARVDGQLGYTVADGTAVPHHKAGSILLRGGDVAHHMQVLDLSGGAHVAEERTAVGIGIETELDGMPLAIEQTAIVVVVTTNHSLFGTIVDVSRQLTPSMGFTTIHQFGKGLQVFGRTYLVSSFSILLKRPRRHTYDCHNSHQAQTQESFLHKWMFLVELFVCYLSDIHLFTQTGPASSCHIPWLLEGPFLAFVSLKLHLFYT